MDIMLKVAVGAPVGGFLLWLVVDRVRYYLAGRRDKRMRKLRITQYRQHQQIGPRVVDGKFRLVA